jgi:predicted DCC family thiol-disulfide oxidoreductase YuxK
MAWIRLFKRLDWLSAYEFVGSSVPSALKEAGITPEEADVELKLKTGGRVLGGFDAVREILCNLPATFLLAPLLSLPGIRDLGHRAYRAVAMRRKCGLAA